MDSVRVRASYVSVITQGPSRSMDIPLEILDCNIASGQFRRYWHSGWVQYPITLQQLLLTLTLTHKLSWMQVWSVERPLSTTNVPAQPRMVSPCLIAVLWIPVGREHSRSNARGDWILGTWKPTQYLRAFTKGITPQWTTSIRQGVWPLEYMLLRSFENSSGSCQDIDDCRTISAIVWSCVATLVACTWASVHPNVPDPESGLRQDNARSSPPKVRAFSYNCARNHSPMGPQTEDGRSSAV